MRFALILSLILAILAVVFALQNPAYMDVNLGPFEINGSTALILMITFGIGVLVGILAATPSIMKRRKQVRALEKRSAEPVVDRPVSDPDIHTTPPDAYRTE